MSDKSHKYDGMAQLHAPAAAAMAMADRYEADLLLARARIAALEAVLRCCLADPRIPTDLWRVIEPVLATAETEAKADG